MKKNKQLLIEYYSFKPSSLNELVEKDGGVIVKGVLQRANSKNQNGRIYPKGVLQREVDKYIDEFVKQNRAFGEVDHPDSQVVSLWKTGHMITEMHWEGDDLMGTVKIFPETDAGRNILGILKGGGTIGISSRGTGSVKQLDENTVEVQEDFELVAFDLVANPSTIGAFMKPVKESVSKGVAGSIDKINSLLEYLKK